MKFLLQLSLRSRLSNQKQMKTKTNPLLQDNKEINNGDLFLCFTLYSTADLDNR